MFKKLASVFLVLVVLSSVVSPALAASIEQKACPSCSKAGNSKIAVVDVIGIEKNEIIAKALKNKDVRKLANMLGREDITNIRVKRVYTSFGSATIVAIPIKTKNGRIAEVAIILTKEGTKIYAVELLRNGNKITGKLYYIDSEGNVRYKLLSDDFWSCLYNCVGGLAGIGSCAATCARCAGSEGGDIWDCILCAICLGNAGCCVGKCAMNEPWGPGFCYAMYIDCILGYPVACIIYEGCKGHCPL